MKALWLALAATAVLAGCTVSSFPTAARTHAVATLQAARAGDVPPALWCPGADPTVDPAAIAEVSDDVVDVSDSGADRYLVEFATVSVLVRAAGDGWCTETIGVRA